MIMMRIKFGVAIKYEAVIHFNIIIGNQSDNFAYIVHKIFYRFFTPDTRMNKKKLNEINRNIYRSWITSLGASKQYYFDMNT